jgi:hypothetical protein
MFLFLIPIFGFKAGRKLPGAGICRNQSGMFFSAFNDSWKAIRGFVAQIGNIDHIDRECLIVKILNL